ncbi:MAG: hypothetical protein BJBARM5_0621 [Candidatus Parvarchaeum acidophilus ARMAN-5]|jgi:hypothetical protein|uniref:Uncharacterized protein n=1 Tax=Candidatus Parvarchaeum acidophilus ARMAN-5 TaxID=662762 RepID=D6GVV2_PARA5|nr:MAG: hypothetical protein BJBARM5_0621 [Candidatus Parvarchaeum acidophilus ARMAN-5]
MVKEDYSLSIMLFKDSKDYEKTIKLGVMSGRDPTRLLGKNIDGQIECYIDNIVISTYNHMIKENKNFEDSDKELDYRIKKDLDEVVIHELTHRITEKSHPSKAKNLSLLASIIQECIDKGNRSNISSISKRGYDNQYAKKLLFEKYNKETYTTEDFNNTIDKAISWYSDRY